MRYNKKKVLFLLVPLLIIIFFSGNANADTYSFSAGSTFEDQDIFFSTVNSVETINGNATGTEFASDMIGILSGSDQRSVPKENYKRYNDTQEFKSTFIRETNRSSIPHLIPSSLLDPHYYTVINSSSKYVKELENPANKVKSDEHEANEGNGDIDKPGTSDSIQEPLPEETPTLTPEAESVICVDINSSPEGAEIRIDEEYNDVTPSTINFDRPGNHTIKLVLDGHKTYQESFFISESMTLDVIWEPLQKETPTSPTPVPEPSDDFEKNQKKSGNTTKGYKEESLTENKSKSSSAFFPPSPKPPGFLAMYILIAIILFYFLKCKNKR
jgi:hypothetical protein